MSDSLLPLRREMDERAALPVLLYFGTGILWLLAGTVLGVASSLKFNAPDWLGSVPALTFGRIRPAHLNAVMYGWASLAGAGCIVWLTSRLCQVPVQWRGCLIASAALWNAGLVYGVGSILLGYSAGVEWLEFPLAAVVLIALAFLLYAASILRRYSATLTGSARGAW